MSIISHQYKKQFVCRYDKEVGIPYYSFSDFKGLKQEAYSFTNSLGIELKYFFYYYDNYRTDKIVLFLHGLGPGHTAYLAEIEFLAKAGYKVLTLDYMGCEESQGNDMRSLNEPTRDVNDLLDYLKLDKPIVVVGHSLGGYTALNIINIRKEISKAVIISGFLSIESLMKVFVKSKLIYNGVIKYEKKMEPDYFQINNLEYLKTTKDKIFFIQSDDDPMVPYIIALNEVEQIDNPNIKTLRVTGKKHNPNYSLDAVNYMNEIFGQYNELLKKKKIRSDENRINFFKDVSLSRLTEQDKDIVSAISEFIN